MFEHLLIVDAGIQPDVLDEMPAWKVFRLVKFMMERRLLERGEDPVPPWKKHYDNFVALGMTDEDVDDGTLVDLAKRAAEGDMDFSFDAVKLCTVIRGMVWTIHLISN